MNEIVDVKYNQKKGFFYVKVDNQTVAIMTFAFDGDKKIIIKHTDVSEVYKGNGYGKMMVTKAVDFARENGLKIFPRCFFAKRVFDQTPAYNDVLINS